LSRGHLVVIEGIDGAGKTAISKEVVNRLTSIGIQALYTYEPYETPFTDLIKHYGRGLDPVLQTLLMAADRYYHVKEVIEPYLRSGYLVVSDRYYYSSIAYQGGQGVDIEWIINVNKFVPKPSLAIYLDVRPEVGLERKKYSDTRIKYLQDDMKLLHTARDIYLGLVGRGELIFVNAERDFNSVLSDVLRIVYEFLGITA